MNHLDVKPDNIMMVGKPDGLHPVLIDFGLSLHFKKNGSVTNKKAGLGTSDGYSPLEQYAGITKFSPSADVYALGATLLYMLTGKNPVRASDMSQKYIINALPDDVSEKCSSLLINALKKVRMSEWLVWMDSRDSNTIPLIHRMKEIPLES